MRERRFRNLSLLLFAVGLPLEIFGFALSFGVTLAYLTSHGSAGLSPMAERLQTQWYGGRALTLVAALLLGASVWASVEAHPRSGRAGWWLILPLAGAALVALDLLFLGVLP
ncbi:MAG TPA: hypothetical protein VFF17_08390 [Thermoanaerobaculia bacterium]|nr:hypothetical protein [Thermoanaerobaculia bacterium]